MRCLLPLLVGFCLAFAPAPFPRPTKTDAGKEDLKKMQGTWAVARRTLSGREITSRNADMTVVIIGDRIRFLLQGELRTEWAITLDVTKNPKVLDRKKVAGIGRAAVARPGTGQPLVLRGIYRLDGDTLQLSHTSSRAGQDRPSDFEGKKSGETTYFLKRARP
jgi:uncharacterized protein (TIGR03067 family)